MDSAVPVSSAAVFSRVVIVDRHRYKAGNRQERLR
jgi:hypothetical protein